MGKAYKMKDDSTYLVVMRTRFTQPDYPCGLYRFKIGQDWRYYFEEVYSALLHDGLVMKDVWLSRDLIDVPNCLVSPNDDLGTCLYMIGEIVADGEILGSKALVSGGRYGRTDIGTWMRVEDGGEMRYD